jgi:hypothetical protein
MKRTRSKRHAISQEYCATIQGCHKFFHDTSPYLKSDGNMLWRICQTFYEKDYNLIFSFELKSKDWSISKTFLFYFDKANLSRFGGALLFNASGCEVIAAGDFCFPG